MNNRFFYLCFFILIFYAGYSQKSKVKGAIKQVEVYALPFSNCEDCERILPYESMKQALSEGSFDIFLDTVTVALLAKSLENNVKYTYISRKQDYLNSRILIRYKYEDNKTIDYFINLYGRQWINYFKNNSTCKQKYNKNLIIDIISVAKNEKLKKILLNQEVFLNKTR